MTAKGYTGLSDAAERHIRELVRMGWSPENARKLVEPVTRGERNRLLASLRGRLQFLPDEASRRAVASVLDELEERAPESQTTLGLGDIPVEVEA